MMVRKSGSKGEIEALSRDKKNNILKGNHKEVAEICNYLGELLMRDERYEDAISEHETELEMCGKTRDRLGQAIANRKIGECYCAMGDYDKALRFQQKHLNIAQELNSDIEQQRAHATIGRTYMCRAEGTDEVRISLRRAKSAFNSSLNFAMILKDDMEPKEYSVMVGRLYLNLGILAEMGGSITSAVKYLQDARRLMETSKLPEEELKCLTMLSSLSSNQGDLESAQDFAQNAYGIAKLLKSKAAVAEALIARAGIALESEQFLEARHCLKKILKAKPICEAFRTKAKKMLRIVPELQAYFNRLKSCEDGTADQIKLMDAVADSYCSVECYYSALRFYKRMLDAAKANKAPKSELAAVHVSLTQTSVDLKNFADAIRNAKEEIKLRNDPVQRCRTWINIADYADKMEECDGSAVIAAYDRAIAEAELSGRHNLLLKCLNYQQSTCRDLGDLERAGDLGDKIRSIIPNGDDESEGESIVSDSKESSPDIGDLSSLTESDEEQGGDDAPSSTIGVRRGQYKVRRNEKGETLLHTAAISGQLKRVKQLINAGHPVNERDHCGWLPIHEAANHNHLEIAVFLIEHNALLNDPGLKGCNGLTPILDAAYSGNLDMVRLLRNRGAVVTCKDGDGKTVVDALMEWKREAFSGEQIDAKMQSEFDDLVGGLQAAMIQAGMRPDELRSRNRNATTPAASRSTANTSASKGKAVQNSGASCEGRSASPGADMGGADLYKDAINGIRGTTYRRRQEKRKRPPSPLSTVANDNALVRTEDFTGDDWLIEDMAVRDGTRIPRETADVLFTTGIRQQNAKRKPSSQNVTATKMSVRRNSSTENYTQSNMEVDLIDIARPSRSGVDRDVFYDSADDNLPNIPSHQVRTPHVPPPSISPSRGLLPPQPIPQSASSAVSTANPPSSFGRLRVRIEDVAIVVPVAPSQDRKIAWLADEAATRYFDMIGVRPNLQLKTADGAILATLDLVRDVVAASEEIIGEVVSWHNPPVPERYTKACVTANVREMTNIRQLLMNACQNGSFSGPDMNISSGIGGTIFRSLQFQKSLRQLNLESNPIGDDGFQLLLDALVLLPNITHLELACTELSNISLDALKRTVTNPTARCLQCLSDLNLSHNQFTDEGASCLPDIISELPCLTTLILEDCDFTGCFLDEHEGRFKAAFLKLTRLRSVSFGFNALGATGASILFSVLPPNLKNLNISGCILEGQSLHQLFDLPAYLLPRNLESLLWAESNWDPRGFPDFMRFLANFPALCTLNLSRHCSLGVKELEILLDAVVSARTPWTSLDISGIPSAALLVPQIRRITQENPRLRELTVTVEDATDRASLAECWANSNSLSRLENLRFR